jgi:hypothetical protein
MSLLKAIEQNKWGVVKTLLNDWTHHEHSIVLIRALQHRAPREIIEIILQRGGDPNGIRFETKHPILTYIVHHPDRTILNLLCIYGGKLHTIPHGDIVRALYCTNHLRGEVKLDDLWNAWRHGMLYRIEDVTNTMDAPILIRILVLEAIRSATVPRLGQHSHVQLLYPDLIHLLATFL